MLQRWPDRIWIVRHGESAGNVARDAAMDAGQARIAVLFIGHRRTLRFGLMARAIARLF